MNHRNTVDLNDHLNRGIAKGNPADFGVETKPVFVDTSEGEVISIARVPNRVAIVRKDNGLPISVVSDRYTVVEHQTILNGVAQAIKGLDVGEVPSGVYVDRNGTRMRALFKFPALARELPAAGARSILGGRYNDRLCPVIKIENTYDGTSRVSIHIGAFRFVCTNLAVGGGGVFAGGFMSVHVGEIPIDETMKKLAEFLGGFDDIIELYRSWSDYVLPVHGPWTNDDDVMFGGALDEALEGIEKTHRREIKSKLRITKDTTVFDAYNAATDYATHRTRTARVAFTILNSVNAGFQRVFGR